MAVTLNSSSSLCPCLNNLASFYKTSNFSFLSFTKSGSVLAGIPTPESESPSTFLGGSSFLAFLNGLFITKPTGLYLNVFLEFG